MAGTVLERQLTEPGITIGLAAPSDDAGIRRLLRDNPTPGSVSLGLTREPDYFAEERAWPVNPTGPFRQTVVARYRDRIAGVGNCTFHTRYLNGALARIGYLSSLRLDAPYVGRFSIARRGYRLFENLQRTCPAASYFTLIASDNERSRRILERGAPGMPKYHFVCEHITLAIPVPARAPRLGPPPHPNVTLPELGDLLNAQAEQYQFAPGWTPELITALAPLGLTLEDFHIIREHGRLVACAALWDQRRFKQTILRQYSSGLSLARPFINAAAWLRNRPSLPPPGSLLANASISHFAVPRDRPDLLHSLFRQLVSTAAQRQIQWLTIGFAESDRRLAELRRLVRGREYRARIYQVQWPDLPHFDLDQRIPFLELALL